MHDWKLWEDGLQLLTSLKFLRLQSWRSLRETPSREDSFIRAWLTNSPPKLQNVKIWTNRKARATGTGERMVTWCPQAGGWQKAYEQEGWVDESDFV